MRNQRETVARTHRHPAMRRTLILLGEVALGGLLGAAITVVEDRMVAGRVS